MTTRTTTLILLTCCGAFGLLAMYFTATASGCRERTEMTKTLTHDPLNSPGKVGTWPEAADILIELPPAKVTTEIRTSP